MSAIPTTFGSGGANLAPGGAAGVPDLATALREAADDFTNLQASIGGSAGGAGRVYHGGLVTDPTTGSTQATGAAGITVWRVDVSACEAQVNSVDGVIAASADEVIHDTDVLLTAVGNACYAAVILVESGGTISISSVEGAEAVAASAVAPTDAEIDAAVTHSNWTRLAVCYLERDADTTVIQSQVNAGYGQPAALAALLTTKA